MARWTLRSLLESGASPVEALGLLNDGDDRPDARAALRDGGVHAVVGGRRARDVTVACAGHPAPILVPAGGTPQPLAAEGTLVGVLPAIELHPVTVELAPGDGRGLHRRDHRSGSAGGAPARAGSGRPSRRRERGGSLADALERLSRRTRVPTGTTSRSSRCATSGAAGPWGRAGARRRYGGGPKGAMRLVRICHAGINVSWNQTPTDRRVPKIKRAGLGERRTRRARAARVG